MPSVTVIPTITQQVAAALEQVRKHRHQPDCRCGLYRNSGAPFCTSQESSWCSILDRLIDRAQNPLTSQGKL